MHCESGCFEMDVYGCDNIPIPTSLAALTSYNVKIRRPGSKVIFDKEVMTNSQGNLVLTGYPLGLFNRGEIFQMQVFATGSDEPLQLLLDSEVYECVLLKVIENV